MIEHPQLKTVALLDPELEERNKWKSLLKNINQCSMIKELETANDLHDLLLMEVPDLILFEYYLPDTKGNYLLAELSDNSDRIWVPTVMSSARCPDAVIIDAYRRGLHSFVNKQGLNCETLSAAISTANDKVYRMKIFNEDKLFSTMNTA